MRVPEGLEVSLARMQAEKLQALPVGVIGLGSMGMGVARSLLRAGFSVTAYDIRPEARRQFAELGGREAEDPAEVGRRSRAVVILVVNAKQTEEVIFGANGLAQGMERGSVIVSSSTVPPAFAVELGSRIESVGLLNIDAPVSGGVKKAAEGQLTVMSSGPAPAFEICAPLFDAIAAKVYQLSV